MFADEEVIKERNLGIGDEIFITGLFTKVTETTKNIPIVRTGNVAMIPGEKIPFGDSLIEAYLVEARSIGGLSGSPVFIRETLAMEAYTASGRISVGQRPLPSNQVVHMQGLGRFYFFGSMIGHWEIPEGFTSTYGLTPTQREAVNMGIAPVVPAHKIKEIILQQEIMDMMKEVDAGLATEKRKGAVLDFAPSKKEKPFTQSGF